MSNTKPNMPGTANAKPPREYITVTCGSTTVVVPKPSEEQIQQGIREGRVMLEKLLIRLQKPGIKLPERPDVPVYFNDPTDPWRMIRKWRGKYEEVTLVDGKLQSEADRS